MSAKHVKCKYCFMLYIDYYILLLMHLIWVLIVSVTNIKKGKGALPKVDVDKKATEGM